MNKILKESPELKILSIALIVSFIVLIGLSFINNSNNVHADSNYIASKDTITVNKNQNNILRFNTISNYSKWNIDTLTTDTTGFGSGSITVDTLVMAQPEDKIFDNFEFQRYTGQIIINAKDSVMIGFPGTDFFAVLDQPLILNPAFHDTLFYKTPGRGIIKFSVLHTTIRTLR